MVAKHFLRLHLGGNAVDAGYSDSGGICHFLSFSTITLSLGWLEEFVFYMLSLAFLAVSKRFQRNDKSLTDAIFSEDDDR